MNLKPRWLATGIGSLPVLDPEEGVSLVLEYLPEIPIWPQLPLRGPQEGMVWQYSEGMPRVRSDVKANKIWLDAAGDLTPELETFYEHFLAGDTDYFALSKEFAPGYYAMLNRLKSGVPRGVFALKGHITGPITVGMGMKDQQGGYAIYNPDLFDSVLKTLRMKAVWQIEGLRQFNLPVIIFMDEPAMTSYGSAYFNVSREQIIEYWNELIDGIKEKDGIVGIHCCGNMDWSVPFESRIDIVNFDAYGYSEKLAVYPEELKRFLGRGGVLAWGIVPTDRGGRLEVDFLVNRLETAINGLLSQGIDKKTLFEQSMITPSCGMGSLTREEAIEILKATKAVSEIMRKRF
ncbi:MAG: methionine synthase [Deltaproteobacteria bacterium]